jgi:hypothetical protein
MCNPVNALLGKPKKDNSAAEAAERRRLAIAQGTRSIDSAFSGFDDSFFDNRAQSFVDFASPQLDDQFSDAREKLIFALTRSGNLKSLAGVEGLADLEGEKERAAQGFASEGLNLAQNARNDVESARADLTSQLLASENPGAAAESASRRAGILTQQPSLAPPPATRAPTSRACRPRCLAARRRARKGLWPDVRSCHTRNRRGDLGRWHCPAEQFGAVGRQSAPARHRR